MRQPIYYFYSALILSILFAAWYLKRPSSQPLDPQILTQQQPSRPKVASKQTLEMVFALDTTGSMGGLLEGAKQKIWGIVNEVLQNQRARKVRVGLVAYRDRGDDYVTKLLPLTDDLDKVYSTLMSYEAQGGGDTPEDVRRALSVAVRKAGWSRKSQDIAQILFLVGDAPPHNDYQDEPSIEEIASEALQRGLLVNAIQCGDMPSTRQVWELLASRGQGEYFAIAQNGGVQDHDTPYDRELADLGKRIGHTYVPYGRTYAGAAGDERMKAQAEMESRFAASGSAPARADRALNKAINAEAYKGDLIQQIADGHVKMDDVRADQLPAAIATLPAEEQKREIGRNVAERQALSARIVEVSHRRDSYLAGKTKATPASAPAFDTAVASALAAQTSRR